jgi:hypothetical protein
MKYKIGDKVKFLNEVGGGTISKITGSSMVYVIDNDGFEIPVRATDIVVVGRDEYRKTSSVISLEDELSARNNVIEQAQQLSIVLPDMDIVDSDDYELLLAFVPADQTNPADCNLDLYFINDSSFYCTYIVSLRTKTDRLKLLGHSVIEPDTKEYVCCIDKTEFSLRLNLEVVSFLYKHHEYKYYPPEQVNVDLNPVKFVKKSAFVENDFFDEKAYILKIATNCIPEVKEKIEVNPQELEQAMKQKDKVKPPPEPSQKRKSDIEEVDLHIEALLEDTRGLDNGQILEIQKARFTIALESGLSSRTKKIVFIHGVGNGKLKYEIRRLLDTQYVGLVRYYDASFQEYGFGATMVVLR